MKIKQITLCNVGPYINENKFVFSSDKTRNIVLIGGKNGAGKTTFFKSIKTCLYGSKVWGYDAPCREYFNIIKSLINTKLQYDSLFRAYVEIELEFDDGKKIDTYLLHREWSKERKSIIEDFNIYKNGDILVEEDYFNFVNYLLSIIPPDMFNFYFFDGEAIADFFLGSDGDKNFKNAFLKLYGLDTLSLMVDNFRRGITRKSQNNKLHNNYQLAKKSLDDVIQSISNKKAEIDMIENRLDLCNADKLKLNEDYKKLGGISIDEWKKLNSDLILEEHFREDKNRWLKEVSNNYLPFIIMRSQIKDLIDKILLQQRKQEHSIVYQFITSDMLQSKLVEITDGNKLSKEAADIVIELIKNLTGDAPQSELFDFSNAQFGKLLAQIADKNAFNEQDILDVLEQIKKSTARSKHIRAKLEKSSIDGFENLITKKKTLEKYILDFTIVLNNLNQDLLLLEAKEEESLKIFEKTKTEYEKVLKDKSVAEMSSRAVVAYTLLEEKLIARQSKMLEEEFIRNFQAIINKDNFLDGIVVDNNINVIPYKLVNVTFEQVNNYIEENNRTKFLNMFDKKYKNEIEKLKVGIVDIIKLPAPITAPFSQGERQVYIMSLYLALLKTSYKDIPFFIDTPFARIDSNHREKIVNEFFNGILNQLFILSTDEEIVGKYEHLLDNRISDRYILQIDNYGKTSVKANKYFEVAK